MKREIKVHNLKDIQNINRIVTKYPYDIWIHSNSGMVDAKSILGICALSLNEKLFLVTEDDVDIKSLSKELSPYMHIA